MNNHRLQPNQHQPMQQQQAQASNDPKKQPDVFKNVPDIIEERKKDMDGNYNTINRYVRGNLLGKVRSNHYSFIAKLFLYTFTSHFYRVALLKFSTAQMLYPSKSMHLK